MSDPIVDEVLKVRKELSEQLGNDVTAIIRHLHELHVREMEKRNARTQPSSIPMLPDLPVANPPAQSVS
jgi:hypothetical protein